MWFFFIGCGLAVAPRSLRRRVRSGALAGESPRRSRAGPLPATRSLTVHRRGRAPRPFERTPETSAAGGLYGKAIAFVDFGGIDFTRRESLNVAVFARDKNPVRQRILAAVQAPRRANRALHVGMDGRRPAHAHLVGYSQAAAELPRAAGVLAQRPVFDDDGIFGFGGFHRRVMRVAIVQAHRRVHAVFVVLRAPTPARMADVRPEKPPGLWVEAVRVNGAKVGVMSGDRALRTGWRQRSKERVADGHGHGHPDPHRRRLRGAHHTARRQNNFQRAERSLVDRQQQRRGDALKTTSAAERPAVGPEL